MDEETGSSMTAGIPTDETTKAKIVYWHLQGVSSTKIAMKLGIAKCTALKYVRQYREYQEHVRPKSRKSRFVNEANRNSGIPDYLV